MSIIQVDLRNVGAGKGDEVTQIVQQRVGFLLSPRSSWDCQHCPPTGAWDSSSAAMATAPWMRWRKLWRGTGPLGCPTWVWDSGRTQRSCNWFILHQFGLGNAWCQRFLYILMLDPLAERGMVGWEGLTAVRFIQALYCNNFSSILSNSIHFSSHETFFFNCLWTGMEPYIILNWQS